MDALPPESCWQGLCLSLIHILKKEDYSVEFIGGSGQKRGVNMNTAMQSFGYGLAALLFCIAILGVCHNMTLRSKGRF